MNYAFAVKWLKAFRDSADAICELYADDFVFEDPILDQYQIRDKGDLARIFVLYANKDRTNGLGVHNFRIRGYEGDAHGWWDGDTLVVDTTNFSEKSNYRGSRETLHLIERFRRDRDGLHYEVTVDDPQTWTRPWTAALTLEAQPEDSLFEYACHEGNNSMRNILSAARAAER